MAGLHCRMRIKLQVFIIILGRCHMVVHVTVIDVMIAEFICNREPINTRAINMSVNGKPEMMSSLNPLDVFCSKT
jgi:hypothetical protein